MGCAGLALLSVWAGNQELVERKASELHTVNEQMARQVAPAGLKEGDTVEVKASVRVERSPGQGAVVRDVNVERVLVTTASGTSCATGTVSAIGAGAVQRAPVLNQRSTTCMPGFRQEHLDVPAVTEKGKE